MQKGLRQRIIANNWIRASKVRLIDAKGQQLGIFSLPEALQKARQAGLDLIQVTERVEPPVCKIMDYGKYAYQQSKKARRHLQKGGELKNIRLTFNISQHDLETRAKSAAKFLEKGDKVRLEMPLRGREKALGDFAKQKINKFLEFLNSLMPISIERELKREARGFTMIIAKQ